MRAKLKLIVQRFAMHYNAPVIPSHKVDIAFMPIVFQVFAAPNNLKTFH
jgi:hypothetical protein